MDSLNQVNADFNTILEVYRKQELKSEEGQLLKDNLYTELNEIKGKENNLKDEFTNKEETLKKHKIEFYKFVKIDSRGCKLMDPEIEKLHESQGITMKSENAISEKYKQQGAIVEKCREDLENLRKHHNPQNLVIDKGTYKNGIEKLREQNQNIQNTILKNHKEVPNRACPILKVINEKMGNPQRNLQDIKNQQKRSLVLLQAIEEKKKELLNK